MVSSYHYMKNAGIWNVWSNGIQLSLTFWELGFEFLVKDIFFPYLLKKSFYPKRFKNLNLKSLGNKENLRIEIWDLTNYMACGQILLLH